MSNKKNSATEKAGEVIGYMIVVALLILSVLPFYLVHLAVK